MMLCQMFRVLCAFLCVVLAEANLQNKDLTTLSDSTLKFAGNLYKVLSEIDGNQLVSPLSIHCVLTMLSLGARGITEQKMAQSLSSPNNVATRLGYKRLFDLMEDEENMFLKAANMIYPEGNTKVDPKYKDSTKEVFDAKTETLDSAELKKMAEDVMNGKEDNDDSDAKHFPVFYLMVNVIMKPAEQSTTKLVLVSSVNFKAKWANPLMSDGQWTFYMKPQNAYVRMMRKEGNYKYKETKHARIVELPYKDNGISMFVFLPGKPSDLKSLEAEIQNGGLNTLLKDLKDAKVDVLLPMFKKEFRTTLSPALKKMGMEIIFDKNNADFGGLTSKKTYVDAVVHNTFISFTESGTESTAATNLMGSQAKAVGMASGGGAASVVNVGGFTSVRPEPPAIVFHADHPFIYLVQHKESGQTLFLGRCSDPRH